MDQSHAPTSILFFHFDPVIIFDASERREATQLETAVLRTFHILLKALGFTVYEKGVAVKFLDSSRT
jgi:hypothetical protein